MSFEQCALYCAGNMELVKVRTPGQNGTLTVGNPTP